jgi:glycosyltransferase involved in cell wall biosynthesis
LYSLFGEIHRLGYSVDLFVPQALDDSWDKVDPGVIRRVFREAPPAQAKPKRTLLWRLKRKIRKYLPRRPAEVPAAPRKSRMDWIRDQDLARFEAVLKDTDYDCAIFSYIYYARLLDVVPAKCRKILLVEDFLSVQQMSLDVAFEETIGDEIRSVDRFEEGLCVSMAELAFFSNVTKNVKLSYLPHFLPQGRRLSVEKDIDLFFIGSDNIHNEKGIAWFLERVYPLIAARKYRIAFAGKVCRFVDRRRYPGVEAHGFVEDPSTLYSRTRVVLSPLLSGSGLKIKIVEAMSYGIPVVCTFNSLIGFPQLLNNGCIVADEPEEFAAGIDRLLADAELRAEYARQSLEQHRLYFNGELVKQTLEKSFPR